MKSNTQKFILFFVPILVWFFYNGLFFPKYHTFRNFSCEFHYFKDLAISFTEGQTDIAFPKATGGHDLIKYNDKWYLYWPPAPAIVYIPMVLVFGRNTPDDLISSFLGALNVFLVMGISIRFAKIYKIPINQLTIALIGIFWGLGTVNFYMSMTSAVWFYAQIIGQTFLLSSIFTFLEFLYSRSKFRLILSGILWGMACYSRNDLLFSIFFFVGLFYNSFKAEINLTSFFRKGVLFFSPIIVFSLANMAYNYTRFGSIFENGIQYHQMDDQFKRLFYQHGYFSWHYLKYNFCVEVLSTPPFIKRFPYFSYNWEGFGFLWVSPIFLVSVPMAFFYFTQIENKNQSVLDKNDLRVIGSLIASIVLIAGVIFSIMGTGWVQFGARYTLDFHIFVLLITLFVFKIYPKSYTLYTTLFILLCSSIYINFIGVVYYFNLYPF